MAAEPPAGTRTETAEAGGRPSPGPRILRVGDLDVRVRVSERRRTLGLTVERDGTLTAAVPPGVEDSELARMVTGRQQWIYRRLRERAALGPARPPREFVSGEGFPYLGRSYRLLLVDDAAAPVAFNAASRRLELRLDCAGDGERHLISWYREQGAAWLPPRAAPWAQRMTVDLTGLRVRKLGYRWGSCSADGSVNIHWAVMQLPPGLIDYILVHELAHLRHPLHDRAFWSAVLRCMPDYAARRSQLRRAGTDCWLPEPGRRPALDT